MFCDFYVGSYASADHESIYRYQWKRETGALVRKEAIKGAIILVAIIFNICMQRTFQKNTLKAREI